MDSFNKKIFVEKEKQKYWNIVDLYIGGSEHSTGHLIYSRFFTKFLYDLNFINIDEPFKKLVNQGMIQYKSMFIYRIEKTNILISYKIKNIFNAIKLNIDINLVENNNLNFTSLKKKKFEFKGSKFILYNNQYLCNSSIEKMSKSKYNIINPDNVIKEYGSDTFRIYSMFLGPIEQNKI
jgi:leucyl-tRNA synthetase